MDSACPSSILKSSATAEMLFIADVRISRETKDSQIDPAVGLVFSKKVADPVKKGDLLATIYGNDEEKVKQAVKHFKENFHIAKDQPEKPQMIKQVLS